MSVGALLVPDKQVFAFLPAAEFVCQQRIN
jgi:hypothetical protein